MIEHWLWSPVTAHQYCSHAIGVILMQQDPHNKLMHPIYFISKVISDVEKTFMDIEKWMLTLIYVCKKFSSFRENLRAKSLVV